MIIQITCSRCGKSAPRKDWFLKHYPDREWFCSRECQKAAEAEKKALNYIPCPVCGKLFYMPPYRVKRLKRVASATCSPECRLVLLGWGSRILYCKWCGEGFRRRNGETAKNPFCSRECMGKWNSEHRRGEESPSWKGGYLPYYGKDWIRNRRIARARDNVTCQHCGITQSKAGYTLEIHHKIPVRLFKNRNDANAIDNLITLCRPCHVRADVEARRLEQAPL